MTEFSAAVSAETDQSAMLERYTRVARLASRKVISAYSTSFSLASRLLSREQHQAISDIYALVRVADEIVDGSAAAAGVDNKALHQMLDSFERETEAAMYRGYSADVIVHAFALTARELGITRELTRPFFASMRRDLEPAPFTADGVKTYIYGSAEVVGLMCLKAFLVGEDVDPERLRRLEAGAQHLGAAFQKINFLRDMAADYRTLGRNYFPWVDAENMSNADRDGILDDIKNDIRIARSVVPELPKSSRAAVLAATGLFQRVASRVRRIPAQKLLTRRVSVPGWEKAVIALSSVIRAAVSPAEPTTVSNPQKRNGDL